MAATLTRDVEEVRRIVLDALRGQAARVFLFGSYARGEARPTSDIDVAILPVAPLTRGTLSLLRERLEESSVASEVDLVDLSDADEALRARVFQEGIEWSASGSV
ncbi:MAG: nucleotidyltransferase domain-containing protein [Acidobacteria bacterium]|nr:MAG: nucleotidyltransferase domain-containing protein [Acidobacteriota bacterium]